MKKFIAIIIALCVSISASLAWASTVEFQAKQVGELELWKYSTLVSFGEQISHHFGWTGLAVASTTWSEAYFGPTITPASWITGTVCAGIQNTAQKSRFAAYYCITYGRWTLAHRMEDGDGRWHKLLASYDFGHVKAQYWDQDSLGRGPRIQIQGPNKVSAYAGLMFDGKVTNHAVGVIKGF